MNKIFLNPRQLQRSFSHIGPKFHNKGKMHKNHSGYTLFGKTIIFIGITGIIINYADKNTLDAVARVGQRRLS